MNKIQIILEIIKAAFKQDDLWKAVARIVENRGKIKMAKLNLWIDEASELREIEYDIKESKARQKLNRQEAKEKKREERIKKRGERNQ